MFEVRQVAAAAREAEQAKVVDEAVKETPGKGKTVLLKEAVDPPPCTPPSWYWWWLLVRVACRYVPESSPQQVLALVYLAC